MSGGTGDISVVICAYSNERWQDLVAAVESIKRQSIKPLETILVIDHNEQLFARACTYFSGVTIIENREARGLSGARNSGIAQAQGKFIAFLDDDAIADRDWLMHLSACFEDQRVLAAGGLVEPNWSGQRPAWFPEEFYWVVGCSYLGLPEKRTAMRNLYGGCTCFRREVFTTAGGFRTDIGRVGTKPMGGEETELCIRAKQHWPHKIFLYNPQARIRHTIPVNRASWRYFRSRCYAEGLSKALISRYVGARDSLSSERAYTLKTLPRGVAAGIKATLADHDLTGLLRAGVIIAGFTITMIGYCAGNLSRHFEIPPSQREKANGLSPMLQKAGSQGAKEI